MNEYTFPSEKDCIVLAMIADACEREDYLVKTDGEDESVKAAVVANTKKREIIKKSQPPERQGCVWIPVISWLYPLMSVRFAYGFARYLEIRERESMRVTMSKIILARSLMMTCPKSKKAEAARLEYTKKFLDACQESAGFLLSLYRVFCMTMKLVNLDDAKKQIPLMLKGRNV